MSDRSRGIDAAAVYLPRYRLSADAVADAWGSAEMKGIDRVSVPAADEDAVTMAVAAAKRVLAGWSGDPTNIAMLAFGTTTPPMAEDASRGRLLRAVGLPQHTATVMTSGDTGAGGTALARALDADGPALVVTADAPQGDPADSDHSLGAGAAAFVVTADATVPIAARGTYADDRPGLRYRPAEQRTVDDVGITRYERSALRDALDGAIAECADADTWEALDGVALHQPDGGLPHRMARSLPLDAEAVQAGMVVDEIGDSGAATVPIALCRALAETAGPTGACFFGEGAAMAMLLEGALEDVPGLGDLDAGEEIGYTEYLRMQEYLGRASVAGGGAHVSLPNWQNSIPQRYRLVAGTCAACGGLNFPPSGACQHCHERTTYADQPLDPQGTIAAITTIGQGAAPPEFAAQQRKQGAYAAAIVSLSPPEGDDAVRLPAQVVDCDPDDVDVGDPIRATFRRIYTQEDLVRYGLKFVPA